MGCDGSIPTGTQMGWRTTAGHSVSPSRQLSSCRASRTSLPGRCDAFGSRRSLLGSFLMDLWKQRLLGGTSKDEVIGFTLRWKISARPDGFNKAKLVSSLLAQTGWFLCVQGYGWRTAAPVCPMGRQALPAVTTLRAATSPRDLFPIPSTGTIPIQSYWGWGEEIFLSQQKVHPHWAAFTWGSGRQNSVQVSFFSLLIQHLFLILEGSELRHFAFSVFVYNYMLLW